MGDITQFIPGLAAAVAFGLLTGPWAGARLRVGRALGWATMISLGAILTITLSPSNGIPDPGTGPGICTLSRWWPAPLGDLATINEASLNVVLFIPLGVALGLAPGSRRKLVAVIAAVALPFVIEAVQYLVPALGRYCDSADVADNVAGLVLGLVAGTIAGVAARHHIRSTTPSPTPPDAPR